MTWLLRLFRAFRDLEASVGSYRERVAELSDSRASLQSEVLAQRREIDRLAEAHREALTAERTAYQMLINVDYQRKYGFAPYPAAPKIPETLVDTSCGPVEANYTNARVEQQMYRSQNRAEFDQWLSGEMGKTS